MQTTTSRKEDIYTQLCQHIPGGVNSPVRSFPGLDRVPLIVESGKGAILKDVDGEEYIDFCGSWGALIHGHAHPYIVEIAQKRIAAGSSFGITTEIEEKIAKKIKLLMPNIEKLRFVSSGTEATMSAVRLARGFTQKDRIIKFSGNYHGHSDAFLIQAGSGVFSLNASSSSAGVTQGCIKDTISLPYNDLNAFQEMIKQCGDSIAAVILEPIAANMGLIAASHQFIQALRDITHKYGIILIFDEVISGFRVGLQGAQGYYDVKPDLTCLGKIIGGGFPAAAFGGRQDIMDLLAPLGPVYQAGTLSGNPVAMAAGYAALELLERPNFFNDLEEKTKIITQPVQQLIENRGLNACLHQIGSLFTLFFGCKKVNNREDATTLDLKKYAEFFRYLLDQGIYVVPSQYEANFVCDAHTIKEIEYTRDIVLNFLDAYTDS